MMNIKRYFLFMLMIHLFSLTAMQIEPVDELYRKIRDIIDEKHLGINKYSCMFYIRPLIGSMYAYSTLRHMFSNTAEQELNKIESYISFNSFFNKDLFHCLAENHWYVNGLVDRMRKAKNLELSNITSLLVDEPCSFDNKKNKNNIEKIVEKGVLTSFFSEKKFFSTFHKMRTIELFEKGDDIDPFSLLMSSDEKYFQVKSKNGLIKIWDMHQASLVTEKDVDTITWTKFPKKSSSYILPNGERYDSFSYSTDCIKVRILSEIPKKTDEMKFKIALTMKQIPLYKSCCAFLNSQNNKKALMSLKDSKNFQNMGFPQKDLSKLIDNQIYTLKK